MNALSRIFGTATLALVLGATTADAQPSYQYVLQVQVKQGATAQYEDYVKKVVAAAKSGGAQSWTAFQTTTGGPSNQYIFAVNFDKWGDRDSWMTPAQMLVKAHGAEEAAKLTRAGQALIEHSENFVTSRLPESTGAGGTLFANYAVSRTEIEPEMIDEYRLAISKIWESEAKTEGAPEHTMRRRILGDRWVFHGVTGFENGAAKDRWPNFGEHMRKSYSESEVEQILDTIRAATVSSHWFEIAHRPDLSNAPATASND